jgi:hypothetical protein
LDVPLRPKDDQPGDGRDCLLEELNSLPDHLSPPLADAL